MGALDFVKGLRKEEIGRVAAPGTAVISLPEGKVSLRWEEARAGRNQRTDRVNAPADFDLQIAPAAGGDALEVKPATGGTSGSGRGRIFSAYGSVDVETAGDYRFTAATAEQREDAVIVVRT
jgi:hypothetical protein